MDPTAKLELFASYMNFEPAEDYKPTLLLGNPKSTTASMSNRKVSHAMLTTPPNQIAACGNSPAELQQMVGHGLTTPPRLSEAKGMH